MKPLILILVLTGTAATAEQHVQPAPTVALSFNAGLGVQSAPRYFGAEKSVLGPTGSFEFGSATLGGFSFGGGVTPTWGPVGSFRYIGSRRAEDYAELSGLEDLDPAIELGGGLAYNSSEVEARAVLRRGFGGHEGFVAEVAADYVLRPAEGLTLRAGPRLLAGDDTYADTYFGVTGAEATASQFTAFDPDGGAMSRGVELSATYEFNSGWGVTGAARYEELLGDAASSPITADDDSATFSITITRDVDFSF